MAKSAECGVVPQAKATVEMKRELERMVNSIVEEEDYTVEATDHAMGILWALKDLKLKAVMKPQELLGLDNFCFSAVPPPPPPPPPELRCPISGELMKDPVILASGQVRLLFLFWYRMINLSGPCLLDNILMFFNDSYLF